MRERARDVTDTVAVAHEGGIGMARAWWGSAILALLVALAFHLDAGAYPLCCDAQQYWAMAADYAAQGWFQPQATAGLRTYAYPTLLAGVAWLTGSAGIEPRDALFVLQFVLHVATAALLARAVFPGRRRAAWVAFTLLACNPYAAAYLTVALTDAPGLAVFQAWLACVAHWHRRARADRGGGGWFAVACVLAGLACALRPAYVWLPAVTLLLALWPVAGRVRLPAVGLAVLLPWLALAPQVAINSTLFDRATPLPVADLGRTQLGWGIANLKYATAPKPGFEARMFYSNPLAAGTLRGDDGLDWYLRHPLRAGGTLAAKLAGAFDFDFLEAYVRDRDPDWQWLYRPWPLLLLVLGLAGAWRHAGRSEAARAAEGERGPMPDMGPRILAPLVILAWAAVTLASVVELRFTLPMLALLVPLAMGAALDLRRRPSVAGLAGLALGLAVASALAAFVSAQNVLL